MLSTYAASSPLAAVLELKGKDSGIKMNSAHLFASCGHTPAFKHGEYHFPLMRAHFAPFCVAGITAC